MQEFLKPFLDIQELDIKIIRLMRLKKQRQNELLQIESLKEALREQLAIKEGEIREFDQRTAELEEKIQGLSQKYKSLESQQSKIKKVEEFNALTREMTVVEREKAFRETQKNNLLEQKADEESNLEKIKEEIEASEKNNLQLEEEIRANIDKIDEEGGNLKKQRNRIAVNVDPNINENYERLMRKKKDRVIVPIVNRICSGCQIVLTLQDENRVRRGEDLVSCEHCSRILFWQENENPLETDAQSRNRRHRAKRA